MLNPWYQNARRRNVVDMHIEDWDPVFLSRFDPEQYVAMLVRSRSQSAVVYAHSHVGRCLYPTKVGHMHESLMGRDIFGQVVEGCRKNGISVVAYYSLIYNNWAYRTYPDWRMIRADGIGAGDTNRYGVCCPNCREYVQHVKAQIQELCTAYRFGGIRFDMTFWPTVCCCRHCRTRYAQETEFAFPSHINWLDPGWVNFQRCRERWLCEFAMEITEAVRHINPTLTVEHQSSTYFLPWPFGVTTDLVKANDFLQGDFYGGKVQSTFAKKLFCNISPNQPYGFETSSALDLRDHTSMKTVDKLRTAYYSSLANNGAFVFIDAINPDGTLNEPVYQTMGMVFEESETYEKYLGGQLCQDVGVYLSTESKFDFKENMKLADWGGKDWDITFETPHIKAAFGAARALVYENIPFGVVTRLNLSELHRFKVIILPSVSMMENEEITALRNYVKSGGGLYASDWTSLTDKQGRRGDNFMLSDVFGVDFKQFSDEDFTYMAPVGHPHLFGVYSGSYPFSLRQSQAVTEKHPAAETLAYVVLPYTKPDDYKRFASIHSNPPGRPTTHPAIILNRYGQGRSLYAAGAIEATPHHSEIFANLIRLLADKPFVFESDAPKPVEITVFHQPDKKRYLISLLNIQEELPNVPVEAIEVKMNIPQKAIGLLDVGTEKTWPFETQDNSVRFKTGRFQTFQFYALSYQ